ncbi:trehalose 6-phosphatase [Luteibacter rhizovicinus]|uniref:Trehalose 6-phosphate phosphatase n=1 Tax=Luteibacter rhizovicinus TaxID=242606 RepID=A0A4R3YM79_9GAMM|nr:trehalose-phosphatase [Luteibacter rhizovicinus]TCV93915.1 trehalose 6-phosphatase [Luteibacter rhizovicinus]
MTAPHRSLPLGAPPPSLVTARSALFLDADGTLLAFADDPEGVTVDSGLVPMLDRLREQLGGALALVSGRPIASLDRLFGRPAWAAAGQHGLERRGANGAIETAIVDPAELAALRDAVFALASSLPGVRVEDKGFSIALHCRERPERQTALAALTPAVAARFPGFEVQPGSYVYEFKPRGMDKGKAVEAMLRSEPFAGRRPIYLGDDFTDEHAFVIVNAHGGSSIRVGTREPTVAGFTLPSPAGVHAWLADVSATLT